MPKADRAALMIRLGLNPAVRVIRERCVVLWLVFPMEPSRIWLAKPRTASLLLDFEDLADRSDGADGSGFADVGVAQSVDHF